jgi:hypothetical protein
MDFRGSDKEENIMVGFFLQFCDIENVANFSPKKIAKLVEFTLRKINNFF